MIKCCIFDLDGTLLNTLPTITYYLGRALSSHGREPLSVDTVERLVGHGAKRLISGAIDRVGLDSDLFDSVYTKYMSEYDAAPEYLTEPYPGAVALVDELSRRGIACAILTNKPESAAAPIARSYFGDRLAALRGAAPGRVLKPDPTEGLAMLRELGIDADECAYIGDMTVDIETGRRLGAALVVGVSWGFSDRESLTAGGADAVIDEPWELLDLTLGRLGDSV